MLFFLVDVFVVGWCLERFGLGMDGFYDMYLFPKRKKDLLLLWETISLGT